MTIDLMSQDALIANEAELLKEQDRIEEMMGRASGSDHVSGARHSRANHFSASGLFSGLTSFAELEKRIAELPTPQERGDAFEVFAEAYLATQKVNQASEVWPHDAVPISVSDSLKLPPKDMGVFGVYRTLASPEKQPVNARVHPGNSS